jgi:hypothetical protein
LECWMPVELNYIIAFYSGSSLEHGTLFLEKNGSIIVPTIYWPGLWSAKEIFTFLIGNKNDRSNKNWYKNSAQYNGKGH